MKKYCCANCDCDITEAGYYRQGKKIYCSEECVLEDLGVTFEWIEEPEPFVDDDWPEFLGLRGQTRMVRTRL